jgi:hypothetical protein
MVRSYSADGRSSARSRQITVTGAAPGWREPAHDLFRRKATALSHAALEFLVGRELRLVRREELDRLLAEQSALPVADFHRLRGG